MNYSEEESFLLDMVCESNEEVRDSLYASYEPIIKYTVKQFVSAARKLGLDMNDLMQEANVGFTDALNHFDSSKDASLKTFIQLCIKRRLSNYILKNKSQKNKMVQESLSLDYDYNDGGLPLIEVLGDDSLDPYHNFLKKDHIEDLMDSIKACLSEFEYEVFQYMFSGLSYIEIADILDKKPKQVDNTIQRIRTKIRVRLKGDFYNEK